jgi:hypothetical protein
MSLPEYLPKQDPVADLNVQRNHSSVFQTLTLSHSHDLALLGLLFGAVGDVQATLQLLLLLNSFDHNPVIERTNLHGLPPLMKN